MCGFLDTSPVDIQMRNRPHPVSILDADPDTLRNEPRRNLVSSSTRAFDVEEHEVGFDRARAGFDARNPGNASGEFTGVVVIFRQAFDMVIEGMETGGGNDTGLAHSAAQPVFPNLRLLDERRRPREHAADRTPKPL